MREWFEEKTAQQLFVIILVYKICKREFQYDLLREIPVWRHTTRYLAIIKTDE